MDTECDIIREVMGSNITQHVNNSDVSFVIVL